MNTMLQLLSYIEAATKAANAAVDIAARLQKGDLTEDQARAEWEKTRALHQAGTKAWDAAGR